MSDAGFGRRPTVAQALALADERALSDALADVLRDAEDHRAQYAEYAEAMREFGRGMAPSSAYSPECVGAQVRTVLARYDAARKGHTLTREDV